MEAIPSRLYSPGGIAGSNLESWGPSAQGWVRGMGWFVE